MDILVPYSFHPYLKIITTQQPLKVHAILITVVHVMQILLSDRFVKNMQCCNMSINYKKKIRYFIKHKFTFQYHMQFGANVINVLKILCDLQLSKKVDQNFH
jgi:hypothetical protein